MAFEKRNGMGKLKGMAMAAGLGLAGILSSASVAEAAGSTDYKASPQGITSYAEAQKVYGIPGHLGFRSFIKSQPYSKIQEIANSFADTPEGRAAAREFADKYQDWYLVYATDAEVFGKENCNVSEVEQGPWKVKKYDYLASAQEIHEKGKVDCEGQFYAVAALLKKFYPPIGVSVKRELGALENTIRSGGPRISSPTVKSQSEMLYHIVYAYCENNRWGIKGVSNVEDREPICERLEQTVSTLRDPYTPKGKEYSIDSSRDNGGLVNLDEKYGDAWINGRGNLRRPKAPSKNAVSNVNAQQTSAAYNFMVGEVRKAGFKKASKLSLVERAVSSGIPRNVAEKQFETACRLAEIEYQTFVQSMTNAAIATGDNVARK